MMVKWVLILIVHHGDAATMTTHDFYNESACRKAGEVISDHFKDTGFGWAWDCIPDGLVIGVLDPEGTPQP